MLDVTKKVWDLLLQGKNQDEIMKETGCSISSVCKIRAEFNKKRKNGELASTPSKFPQKPRGKRKKKKKCLDAERKPPANYPEIGKPDAKITENFEKGEKSFDVKSYEIKTLDDLIRWADVDMEKFDCVSFTANRWGNSTWECTQCKAIFKPKVRKGISPEEAAEVFSEMIKDYEPPIYRPYVQDCLENIAIMPIADFHFGAYALKNEVGSDNNLEISRGNLLDSVQFHLNLIRSASPEYIIIPILGDFFNVDTSNSTTTAGTWQEETSSWRDTYRKGCELMIEVIDMCIRVAPVKLFVCNGNHDLMGSFSLNMFLEAWYKNSASVTVDSSHSVRKYDRYGSSIFGFGHGDTKANADYLGIMCEEAGHLLSNVSHRNMFIGHLHHKVIEEKASITIRRVGSLTSSDNWHKTKGYQSVRSSESYIVDKDDGICSNFTFYIR